VQPGSSILCADGSIVLEVISTDPAAGTVRARCKNTAMLGERKNVNLPGVVVDLPTLTDKDVDDIVNWGVANEIDLIAASFVRKGSDLDLIRDVLGERGRYIKIISKVCLAVCLGCVGCGSGSAIVRKQAETPDHACKAGGIVSI
jgi:pyruvate kinase